MPYTITTTDGNVLTTVPDGITDSNTTSITLIGKNVTSYGQHLNENFVKLTQNFASVSQPENPLAGQLWFDTSTNRLMVYDGNGFRPSGKPIVAPSQPLTMNMGDLWINNNTDQMYFYDGINLVLCGPPYTKTQGPSGLLVVTVFDTFNRSHTTLQLFIGTTLIGIYSVDEFTPLTQITGYGSAGKLIKSGFNIADNVTFSLKGNVQICDSSTQTLSIWGSTPTTQPTLSTGAGHTVDDVITLLQTLGLCKQ